MRKRLFFYFFTVSFVSIITISFFYYMNFTDLIRRNALASNEELLSRMAIEVESLAAYMRETADQLQSTSSYKEIMRKPVLKNQDRYIDEITANVELLMISQYRPKISGLYILGDNNVRLKSTYLSFNSNSYIEKDWYKQVHESGGLTFLGMHEYSLVMKSFRSPVLTFGIPFYDAATKQTRGVIIIEMDHSLFANIIKTDVRPLEAVAIMDAEGSLVHSMNQTSLTLDEFNALTLSLPPEAKESAIIYTTNDMLLMTSLIDSFDWLIVSATSMSEITKGLNDVLPSILLITIVVFCVVTFMTIRYTRHITNPIQKLSDSMNAVKTGDFSGYISKISNDEIGKLSSNFNTMLAKINELIDEAHTEERKRRIAELNALQAQINPHFLYNTLDSIIWLSRSASTDLVIKMTESLAKLFRISISKGRDLIPIKDELHHLKSYFTIQKIRYQDKFEYIINCPQELEQYFTKKLILQPLAENAIYHGVRAIKGKGLITVDVTKEENSIVFKITDSGPGMDKYTIQNLRQYLDHSPLSSRGSGYGLLNVNDRIQISYGPEYGITFYSVKKQGSTFLIRIPILLGEETYD